MPCSRYALQPARTRLKPPSLPPGPDLDQLHRQGQPDLGFNANSNVRASLRAQGGGPVHEYLNVTPLGPPSLTAFVKEKE
jgi:hypothetical protein